MQSSAAIFYAGKNKRLGNLSLSRKIFLEWRWRCVETKVVYHLQQLSGNSGWKVNGTRLFGSFQWKISRSNGTSEKVVPFFRTECSKRKFVYHLFKSNL